MSKIAQRACLILIIVFVSGIAFCQTPSARFFVSSDAGNNISVKSRARHVVVNDVTSTVTPPNITYDSPQNYVINQPITPLAPANSGGAVPATIYGTPSVILPEFSTLTGVALNASGNIFLAGYEFNLIYEMQGNIAQTFAGSGQPGNTDGPGAAAQFFNPDGLAFDNSGNLYVSEVTNNDIRKISPSGDVSTFAGHAYSSGAVNGPGNLATFNSPRGMVVDNAGNLYVADQGNNLIREITPAGVVSTFAGTGAAGSADGPLLSASFNSPTAIAIDALGNLYVSDSGNGSIRKITPAGVVSTIVTGLNFPRELKVDATGNIYLVEQNSGQLVRISPDGTITNILNFKLYGPIGLALDGQGNLYLTDMGVFRKVVISGYTIDKPLPAGLTFDPTTGIISGTPTALSPLTSYTITAYNGGGSSTTVVEIAVNLTRVINPSVIKLPLQQPGTLDSTHNYDPKGTSNNHETPITYTSSNPAVAVITPTGLIHVVGPGVTIITAYQQGNADYTDAVPVQQTLTVAEYLYVQLPVIAPKTICDADFSANAVAAETRLPMTYSSSNPAVATISTDGLIHIAGPGTSTITVFQNADPPLYVSAPPQSQTLTVTLPVAPVISIAAKYTTPCIGSPITFTATATNGGANPTYQWAVNGNNAGTGTNTFTSSTLADGDAVTCTIINTDGSCIAGFPGMSNSVKVSLSPNIISSVSIAASVNGVFPGVPITFTADASNAGGTVTYQWQVNGNNAGTNSPVFISSTLANEDNVTCTITPTAACSVPASSKPIKVVIVTKLIVPNTLTPNGDGINDTWNITGISDYPGCTVNIYTRYGTLVFRSKGYHDAWDGTVNGARVPASTYYYVIDLGSDNKKVSGWLAVIR